ADDEAELELEVETAARGVLRGVRARWAPLPARADDIGAADDDGAGPAVVADGQPAPVGQQRLLVRPEDAAGVRRVLERREEVDVVRDLEGQVQRRLRERHPRPLPALEELERA